MPSAANAIPSTSSAGRPDGLVQERRLAAAEQDGLDCLAGSDHASAVSLRQQLVQRIVLEIGGEQAGKPLGREVDLLEQQWLAGREAKTLQVERRRAELEAERGGDRLAGRLGRAATTRVSGSRPRLCISSVNDSLSARSRSMRGCRTSCRDRGVRSIRFSRVSSRARGGR